MNGKLSGLHHLVSAMESIPGTPQAVHLQVVRDSGLFTDSELKSVLSADEVSRASQMEDTEERRHFVFRRCFQRLFVAQVVAWDGLLSELVLVHNLDQRPFCRSHPHTAFSFSSSRGSYLFGSAASGQIGVDLEMIRIVENAADLAKRFFSADEATAVETAPELERDTCFLTLWSAKEAGLKATGHGVDFGLNLFTFTNSGEGWRAHDRQWTLSTPSWRSDYIVTVMHRTG